MLSKEGDGRGEGSVHLRRCEDCGHVFLEGFRAQLRSELYDYYAQREQLPRDELYDSLTDERS